VQNVIIGHLVLPKATTGQGTGSAARTGRLAAGRLARSCRPGSTADPFWDWRIARSVTVDVVEINGNGHSMFVPGRVSASAAVLRRS
jgi:hypothetical protein